MASNKGRILFLLQYLQKNTDEYHAVSSTELVELYAANDFNGNRKTVKDDIQELIGAGYDIYEEIGSGTSTTYSYVGRLFDLPEVKMLIDAVSSARFISAASSKELIDKLTQLASRHAKDSLTAMVYPSDRVITASQRLYYVIDIIQQAILAKKKIRFQYLDYNVRKELILHNDGEYYDFSPYCCAWNGDRYYLLGRLDKRPDGINPFRIDLMCTPEILDEDAFPPPEDFNPAEYAAKVFRMFNGKNEKVTLEADNRLMKKFIDRFGEEFPSWPVSDTAFRAEVEVAVSPTFYAWISEYSGQIRIVAPDDAKAGYIEHLKKLLSSEQE
ncbi:MAG: WYL domain-containing protein [Lachnospiraceae bacterium]|nr:WYL domain-containing protein [Lachnospiraceae bacterium]